MDLRHAGAERSGRFLHGSDAASQQHSQGCDLLGGQLLRNPSFDRLHAGAGGRESLAPDVGGVDLEHRLVTRVR